MPSTARASALRRSGMMSPVEKAIRYAAAAHAGVRRKGKNRPYILHPIEAMTIVGKLTDDEELLAAAVLHDTLEDTTVTREDLEREFGRRVADLVASESEDKRRGAAPADTWLARKQETVDHLRSAGRDVRLLCLADKLANLRELARDHRELGDGLWERFHQKDKAMHAWYYRSVCDAVEEEFGRTAEIREYRELLREVFGGGAGK